MLHEFFITVFTFGGDIVSVKYHVSRTYTVKRSKVKVTRSTYRLSSKYTAVANRQPHEPDFLWELLFKNVYDIDIDTDLVNVS